MEREEREREGKEKEGGGCREGRRGGKSFERDEKERETEKKPVSLRDRSPSE